MAALCGFVRLRRLDFAAISYLVRGNGLDPGPSGKDAGANRPTLRCRINPAPGVRWDQLISGRDFTPTADLSLLPASSAAPQDEEQHERPRDPEKSEPIKNCPNSVFGAADIDVEETMAGFSTKRDGVLYLTEGGQETEIMYKFGHELPEFAMYPLLEDPAAMSDLKGM